MFVVTSDRIVSLADWSMPLNHAFLYGTSEFSTMRLSDGKFYFYFEHLARLQNKLGLKNILEKVRSNFPEGEWSVRPTFYHSSTDLYTTSEEKLLVLVKPLVKKIHQEVPVVLTLTERGTKNRLGIGQQKIGQYFSETKYPETLFHDGIKILESNVSNIFFRIKDKYFFPQDEASIFWGIGIECFYKFCCEQSVECYSGSFRLDDIKTMDEAWVISSVRGLRAVAQIEEKKISVNDNISKKLLEKFKINLQENFYL